MVNATLRPLYHRERNPVPTVQKAGWVQGSIWMGQENLVQTGIRSPERPTSGKSLYRLHYPSPTCLQIIIKHYCHPFVQFQGREGDRLLCWYTSTWINFSYLTALINISYHILLYQHFSISSSSSSISNSSSMHVIEHWILMFGTQLPHSNPHFSTITGFWKY